MAGDGQVLVSGSAGFIGAALSHALLDRGYRVRGFDCVDSYYSVALKRERIARLLQRPRFTFAEGSLNDRAFLSQLLRSNEYAAVFHLAGRVGVRDSWSDPRAYQTTNATGTRHLLEACVNSRAKPDVVFASSSSVYGAASYYPTDEAAPADDALSPYGASKRAVELLCQSHAREHDMRITGLRYFTVYGPWGRPDMAPFAFAERLLDNEEIELFNGGDMVRDFTYVDDAISGTIALYEARRAAGQVGYDVFNVGASAPIRLVDFLEVLERAVGRRARVRPVGPRAGDAPRTHADITKATAFTGWCPLVSLPDGIERLIDWLISWRRSDTRRTSGLAVVS